MTYTRGNIYTVNIKSLSEKERGVFDFISRLELSNIDDLMPKYTNEIPATTNEEDVNEL